MQIVKVSQPADWENKVNSSTPGGQGIWGDYKFIVTKEKIACDYWVVLGDVQGNEEALCPEENVIYITDEAHTGKKYDPFFLNLFAAVVTSREDINHPNVILAPYICGWFLRKSYDFLTALDPAAINKTKTLSAVSSSLTALDGHKKRFAFINQMIGHFKERLDVYGRGFNEINDKYDALIDYQYSIAVENSSLPRYFSEKIADCFLTYTMPVYYGCSDILDYFAPESMVQIDINNYTESINKIQEAIRTNRYQKNFDYLVDARKIYFEKYHPLQAITQVLQEGFRENNNRKRVVLKSMTGIIETRQPKSELFNAGAFQIVASSLRALRSLAKQSPSKLSPISQEDCFVPRNDE